MTTVLDHKMIAWNYQMILWKYSKTEYFKKNQANIFKNIFKFEQFISILHKVDNILCKFLVSKYIF